MTLKRLLSTLAVATTLAASAQMMPEVPVDTAVRIGQLDNGLTYYIRYNNWPEHRADFYIAQKVGSIQEEENQRGLAHFLEHMCFNGTDNFEGNGVIRYCESIGVSFGRDLNAYTSIDETVYNISNVPTTNEATLDSCLLILRDWADGLTLDPDEIDKERGVIHEEWRLRSTATSRMLERNLPALYPGSKYGLRYPIGLMSVVDNFQPEELRDYYEKWYNPANQGIIVVGDVDVDHIEAQIKLLFGPMTNPDDLAEIVPEPVPNNEEPIVIIDKDKEQTNSFVEVMLKHEPFPAELKGTVAFLLYKYCLDAAVTMLNARLIEKQQEPDCPFVSATAGDGEYIYARTMDAFYVGVQPKETALTAQALQAAYTELLRAARYGFTATEYDRFKQDALSAIEKQYSNKDKRFNEQFYNQCKAHFLDGEPMPSIDFYYETMTKLIPMLPVAVVNEAFAAFGEEQTDNVVIISFNTECDDSALPTQEQLVGALTAAQQSDTEAYVDNVKDEPLIALMPTPGTIVAETQNDALGYTELTLSNGATVVMKHTDLKKDQVLLSAEGKGGAFLYELDDWACTEMFDDVVGASGLGNFSLLELQKALAGKIANADLSLDPSGMTTTLSASSTPRDFETMLQLTYLYFTAINKDRKSYDNLIEQYRIDLANRGTMPEMAFGDSIRVTLYDYNPRMRPFRLEDLDDVNYDRILEIAHERTANAADWTFTLIGNYDETTVRDLLCQYIAALPSTGTVTTPERKAFKAKGIVNNVFTRKQETPKAMAAVTWHSDQMNYTPETAILADMAGQVLTMVYLKKIREEAGAAYSVYTQSTMTLGDDGYFDIGLFAICPMAPEKSDEAMQILADEERLLAESCDSDMLAKVKEYMLKRFDDQTKTNAYWDSAIDRYRKHGVDVYTTYKERVAAQTEDDVCRFVQTLNAADCCITVAMLPEDE